MRVIALGQIKGGTGKSCLAIHLGCQAVAAGATAAVLDMDAVQATTLKWAKRRNPSTAPIVREADAMTIGPLIESLRREGYDWAFIDLPGRSTPVASAGLKVAHLILVPCRPLDVDVEASVVTVTAAKRSGKRYAYLMNIAPPHANASRARKVADVLRNAGHPVAPVVLVQRMQVPDAIALGRSVDQTDPGGDAAMEFKALFEWLDKEIAK